MCINCACNSCLNVLIMNVPIAGKLLPHILVGAGPTGSTNVNNIANKHYE